jgi:histidine triad (HIT) family protein
MSEDCIFCGIVAREIPGTVVHETDLVLGFLDVNPLATGHTLVIPKDHYHRLEDVPQAVAGDMMAAIHRLAPAVEEAVDAPATTVAFNNGEAAGQEVPHVHGHIVPRFDGDGGGPIHGLFRDRPEVSDEEMAAVGEAIADRV